MKLEVVKNNKILVNSSDQEFEIHPLWLRERARNEDLVDKNNDQRLYDPSQLDQNLKIKNALISNGHLNIEFTDGVRFKYEVSDLIYELSKKDPIKKLTLWNSNIKKKPTVKYEKNIFKSRLMYDVLQDFYKNGLFTVHIIQIINGQTALWGELIDGNK